MIRASVSTVASGSAVSTALIAMSLSVISVTW
jgi:hypothetical protein